MENLNQSRCLNHPGREAVARCPQCKQFFCRECVTEHDGRVLCAVCIGETSTANVPKPTGMASRGVQRLIGALLWLLGALLIWLFFYAIGQLLLLIPDSFHDGDWWRDL